MKCVWILLALCAACGDDPVVVIDANPDDPDGDGVVDAMDNCDEHSNPDQHDEDADAIGDACDNCKTIANADQRDLSETATMAFPDGVGDACDLRPGLSGDRVGAFYSFASDVQASAWSGAGWTIANGEVSSQQDARWISRRGEQGDGVMVVAEVAAVALGAGSLVLAVDGDAVSTGAACMLGESTLNAFEGGAGAGTIVSLTRSLAADERVTLIAWRAITGAARTASLECRVIYGTATTTAELALSDDLAVGIHTLATTGASARITSLIVYTAPGPKNP